MKNAFHLIFYIFGYLISETINSNLYSNDFTLSHVSNIVHSDKILNVEFSDLNKLVFKNNPIMKWEGPKVDIRNNVIIVSIEFPNNEFLNNKVENGIWMWFVNKGKKTNSLNFLIEKDDGIYGIDNNFYGMGIKIDKNNLISIINEKEFVEKIDFTLDNNKLQPKFKYFDCQISTSNRLNLRLTFLNGYVYLESFKGTIKNPSNFDLCFLSQFVSDYKFQNEFSFSITGGLKDEKILYIFDTLEMAAIENIKNDEDEDTVNMNTNKIDSEKENKIIQSKLEIINNISNDVYEKTENFEYLLSNFLELEKYRNDLANLEKTKFDFELIDEYLSNSSNNTNNITINQNPKQLVDKKLNKLMDIIRNVTFDKISFFKGDPRENLVKSLDELRNRQFSMNLSIVEMYESTISAIQDIKTKAEKMEVYQIFQQFLFVLIFINALILFGMYKNIQEREERANDSTNNSKLRLAV